MIHVTVKQNDKGLRAALTEFKKQVKKSDILNELRAREHHLPPSAKRRRKRARAEAQRIRDEKMARKKRRNFE